MVALSKAQRKWCERESRTAELVRYCFKHIARRGVPSTDKIEALCRLTWITKARGDVAENAWRVVAGPALRAIFEIRGDIESPEALVEAVSRADADRRLRSLIEAPLGFANFYSGFRAKAKNCSIGPGRSTQWIGKYRKRVWPILQAAAGLRSDAEAREVV